MEILAEPEYLTVDVIVRGWEQKSIRPDPEYQRGRAWSVRQQALLVDSVLRGYPLPRLYFYRQQAVDPLGNESSSFYVVDGLQRIIAVAEFMSGRFKLLDPAKTADDFPPGIRAVACPWAGMNFDDLDVALQQRLRETKLPVVVVDGVSTMEEVRDLFIRLQAGTALTRQQVRDAWPGRIGPYIESLAGKLRRQPRFEFLSRLDRRGTRRDDEEELDDVYHDARTTAAQLLRLFMERGPVTVNARALDSLYHTETGFDPSDAEAKRFERVLGYCQRVVCDDAPTVTTRGGSPAKVTKARLFSVFLTLAELDRVPNVRLDRDLGEVGRVFWGAAFYGRYGPEPVKGKSASATRIAEHWQWFQEEVMVDANLTYLDPQRTFDDAQREELRRCADGVCELCGGRLEAWQPIDYDHKVPWIRGGRTNLENGRAVHQACNRRRGDGRSEEAA